MAERINSYRELRVYKEAFAAAMEIFEMTINELEKWVIRKS